MWTIKHAGPVAQRGRVSQFFLRSLLDDATELFKRANGLFKADRISNLDRAGQSLLSLNRLEHFEVAQIGSVQGIGAFSLSNDDARQLSNESELSHHEQALAQS